MHFTLIYFILRFLYRKVDAKMHSNYNNVAVLVPCYNEEITIKKVVEDWSAALPGARIYVYDNNSSDKTSEIAKNAGAIVRKESMQGKGNVVRRMFREIEADCYIMVDGDDTYPSDKAVEMVDAILNDGVDMVVGDRLSSTYFQENKRPFHNFGNSIVKTSINTLFKCKINDDTFTAYFVLVKRKDRIFNGNDAIPLVGIWETLDDGARENMEIVKEFAKSVEI